MSATERVAKFIVETRLENIPDHVVSAAKTSIKDTICVSLAASPEPVADYISAYIRGMSESGPATVIGKGLKTSPPWAALANGTIGHALDFDDTNWSMLGHTSAAALPAALAQDEAQGTSGRDILEAYIIGFEVASKLGGRNASRHLRQWLAPYMCSGNHGGCRCRCSPARDGLRANFSSPWVCRITTGLLLSRKDICDLDNSCFSYFLKYFLNIDIGPIAFFFCNISVRFTLLCRISMIITTNYYSKGLALEDINCDLPACYRHRRRHNRRRYFSFLASL
ncbi:MAG: hypothetical protein HOC91_18755 [Nitrospinaceae bacterium]|nr:hypothetical protein [Nitrospinaceae bacterium]MBT3434099.1 hypothetical protein [Nitrospinaceae bacterium]MBT3823140.1 hypothetical protein [Nitrospinaceae bacterium]MBT4432555.1 hypothetical protein [Nitrospinaceae bacterium]MBT5369006.1 hypothetical protein [Nitrospinaceae bacterium]